MFYFIAIFIITIVVIRIYTLKTWKYNNNTPKNDNRRHIQFEPFCERLNLRSNTFSRVSNYFEDLVETIKNNPPQHLQMELIKVQYILFEMY